MTPPPAPRNRRRRRRRKASRSRSRSPRSESSKQEESSQSSSRSRSDTSEDDPSYHPSDRESATGPRPRLRIFFRTAPDGGHEGLMGALGAIHSLFGQLPPPPQDSDDGSDAPTPEPPVRSRAPSPPPLMLLPGFAGARLLFSGQPPPPPPPPQRQLPRTQQATDSANATGEPPRAATRAASARTRAPSEFAAYIAKLNKEEKVFFANLDDDAKRAIISKEKALASSQPATALTPLRFKILESAADPTIKHTLLTKLKQFQGMYPGMGEYHKLCNWLNAATRVPFGKYHPLPVRADGPSPSPISEIARYLGGVRDTLDRTVFGHTEAKDQILRLLAQWISNPSARGTAIGIQGPKGVGKTSLIKNGLCEALGLPFGFVALGGASDGSFLEGHGFTYEGSTHGKIAEVLIAAGVMNPVLFFDELDKVSQTHRGEEIIGILTHLTDASQNDRFTDRYFTELPLDISKSIIVFAYNDVSLINPILRDRMVTIHVTGYSVAEKVRIAQDYLLPEILVQYNLLPADINISTQMLEHLIQRIEKEEGVRNLRRALDAIIGWINMYQYLPGDALAPTATPTPTPTPTPTLAFPLTITEKHVAEYLSKSSAHLGPGAISAELARTMYT